VKQTSPDIVRATANSHRLRFISDGAQTKGGFADPAAGELLLRYLRRRQLSSPCLIFAESVATTAYVTGYGRAGSTTDVQILHGYIKALADGVRDIEWVGFDRRWGQQPEALNHQVSAQAWYFIRPLLLYVVGTRLEQDQAHIDFAAGLGITVVTLFTTAELRRYIITNQGAYPTSSYVCAHVIQTLHADELRRMAAAHRLRVLTQNVRQESGALVLSAGEETVKCVRGQGFAAPVLVLCSSTITSTRFVTLYGRAGSTTETSVVRGYVTALASGVRDTEWVGFDRKLV
jgi:hypothetical protein